MSLLKKASIITTPTAYAEDYLYSIKPAYALGENLVSNGGFDTDTDWSKTTGWTISGGKANWNPADAPYNNDIYRAFSFVEGTRYRITFTMSNNTTGRILLRLSGTGNQDVNGVYTYYANGTHTVEFKAQADKNFLRIYGHDSYSSFSIDDFSLRIITDADFDFDRNSTGTRVNEDYLIEDVPYNLLRYTEAISTDFGVTDVTLTDNYSLSPSGTQTSTRAQLTNLGQSRAFNTVTGSVVSGQSYTFSCHYKGTQGQTVYINALPVGETEVSKAITLNGGWQRESVTFTAGSSSNYVYFVDSRKGGTATDFEVWGAQMVKGDQPKEYLKTTDRLDIPRIDYTNGEPSILLEPSRQNEVTYSQDFTQSYWSKNNVTVTSNQAISPEGIQNADKLIIDNGTVSINGGLYKSRSSTQNQDVSFSIFAKAGEFRYGTIAYGSTNANGFHFDLEDGVILSTFTNTSSYTNIGYEMIPYPNGWYRLVVSTTELQQGVGRFIGIRPHNTIPTATNNNYNSTGNGTSGIFVYGGQIEVGSYPTSLIHTSGSAVTRSADTANNAGNSDLISSTEGVLYGELSKPQLDNDAHLLIALINNGATTDQNTVTIGFDSDDDFFIRIKSSGSDILKYNSATSYPNQFYKIAVKYKSGDSSMYIDGKQVASSTNTFTFVNTLNEINFNFDNNNGLPFYGNCKSIMVFKEALSDTELECLTGYNNHELYMNYYNRLSYLGLVEEYNVESDINNYIL